MLSRSLGLYAMSNNFQQKLAFGKIGEGYIANWLKRDGYNILPVYEKEIHEGKGPQLFTPNGNLVAPDLFAFRAYNDLDIDSNVLWIEAKTKSAFSWHRKTQRWVTGIDLHHYFDYIKVANLSPWAVLLLFLHLQGQAKNSPVGCPTGLFGEEILLLTQCENHRHPNWGKSGMVYWAHDSLRKFATLEEVLNIQCVQGVL